MIQELLGSSSSLIDQNKKISIFEPTPPSISTSLLPSSNSNTTTTPTTNSSSQNPRLNDPSSISVENLRCPRCDSSNTKFCYYNNYNLTQPRHFCKTCRRYWTKGGALRNVPIGGGCRKNKSVTVSSSVGKSNGNTRLKTMASEIGRSSYRLDHFSSSPILLASPQSSHLLSLLRASQNPNPDLNSSFGVKEEGSLIGNLNHLNMAETTAVTGGLTLGFDPLAHAPPPPLGLCSPIWKNNQQNGFMLGSELGHQNSGIEELYQRLRSSTTNSFYPENSLLVLSNVASSCSSAPTSNSNSNSTILESSPVAGAELGYWNPTFSWSDLPTTNGAYP